MLTTFKTLTIGQTFDFISPNRIMNSFYARCIKVSERCYEDEDGRRYRVGSTSAGVYHVR
jgi:hypothetical protein